VNVCFWHIAAFAATQHFVGYWTAASTDRRNTSVKSLCWGFKLQGLAWSLVELTRYFVEMSLRVHRQERTKVGLQAEWIGSE
jgi:hypothetical protein